ncbi:MAG: hypothetical protein Q9170_003768 [Blastenia crenularia]
MPQADMAADELDTTFRAGLQRVPAVETADDILPGHENDTVPDDCGTTESAESVQSPAKSKRTAEGKKARPLGTKQLAFGTDAYRVFHPFQDDLSKIQRQQMDRSNNYAKFKTYLLYSNPLLASTQADLVPTHGLRLDDRTVGIMLEANKKADFLTRSWPAEFDSKGMPRATRTPLGNACKLWVNAGDKDADGYVATVEDEGYYFGWWAGLQLLCGKEGVDAGIYEIRPSFQIKLGEKMYWKIAYKCVVQLESGHPDDLTGLLLLRSPDEKQAMGKRRAEEEDDVDEDEDSRVGVAPGLSPDVPRKKKATGAAGSG